MAQGSKTALSDIERAAIQILVARDLEAYVASISVPKGQDMGILGLQSGSIKSALEEAKQEIAAVHSQGIADIRAVKDKAKGDIKAQLAGVKDKISSEISDALHELAQFTNGEPVEETKTEVPPAPYNRF